MPTTDPTTPVGALELTPTVRGIKADTANVLARLAQTSHQPAAAAPSILDPGLQHLVIARQAEEAVQVLDLPTPARLDRMFAVNGSPVRPSPRPATSPASSGSSSNIDSDAAQTGVSTIDPEPETNNPTADQWAALRWCESRGDYSAVNPSGKYRGAYQFDQSTWETVGGTGDPAAAPAAEQDARAAALYQERGAAPWPYCGKYLG